MAELSQAIALEIITRGAARAAGLRSYFIGKPCKHGHVAEQKYAGAQIYRPRGAPTPTRAPGWAAHFADQRTGDLVLTWVDGAQETVVAGGARPCDIGCVATYSTAVALATEATKGVDAGPDPDVGGRQWIDELAACIHRCEQSCDVTWSRP